MGHLTSISVKLLENCINYCYFKFIIITNHHFKVHFIKFVMKWWWLCLLLKLRRVVMGIKDRLYFPDIKIILFCWVVTETQGVDTGSWVKVSSWFFFDLQQLRYGISDHFALSVLCFLVVDAETAISYLVVDPISLFSYWLLTGKSCPIVHLS